LEKPSVTLPSFVSRNQFLIYRLFSLSGLIPVGAFLVVHLLTNASVLGGAASFQSRVDLIHSLGPLLVPVEFAFIFLPMLFHAAVGFAIIAGGLPNVGSYPYMGNVRYTLQRATGMIAFAFILWHIIQLHWMGAPLGGGRFDPHHATSSAATVIAPLGVSLLYAIGVLSAVFHLSNGLWTIGITWGLWTSPAAMQRANVISIALGVVLAAAGLGAIGGLRSTDVAGARQIETRMDDFKRMMEGKAPGGDVGGHGAPGSPTTVPATDAIDLRAPSEPSALVIPSTPSLSPAGN
jgi:succinate dehydrogenase / fumarate reductase cytochrome b subunit